MGRRRVAVGIVTVVGALVALRLHHMVSHHACCDMTSYLAMGRDFAAHGLFGSTNADLNFRTYGYPLFLSWIPNVHAVFAVQLALLFATAWALAGIFAATLKCSRVALYAVLALNPILLAAAAAALSDLLAALAVTLAVALVLWNRREHALLGFVSLFLAGCGAMIRPASVVFVPMLIVFWAARRIRWRAWPALLVGGALPFVPQLVNNWRLFGKLSPLIVQNLYTQQSAWGIKYLKYATLVPAAPLEYFNPWADGSETTFFSWLLVHPGRALATAGMHLFAMFDQDYAVTYIHDRHPWYRWPLGAASFAFAFIAITTLVAILVRCWRRRRLGRIGALALAIAAACSGYALLYLPTAVEARFGLPLFILLSPFAVVRRPRIGWAIAGCAVVIAGLALSWWLANQAPALR